MKPIPDIALVGAMKSGTTTLANVLSQHPRLALAEASAPGMKSKEPGYFSRDERFALGREWYAAHFQHAECGQLTVDASTCYSRSDEYPHAMERLYAANPDVRLIYILRHPIERVYADYLHNVRYTFLHQGSVPSLESYLENHPECLAASKYDRQIEHIHQHFPKNALLCLRFDDLKTNPTSICAAVALHANIVAFQGAQVTRDNATKAALKQNVQRQTIRRITQSPALAWIRQGFPTGMKRPLRSILERIVKGSSVGADAQTDFLDTVSPMTNALRARLHTQLDPHTRRLEDLLGWSVDAWFAHPSELCDESAAAITPVRGVR